jgi:hypothetical protein
MEDNLLTDLHAKLMLCKSKESFRDCVLKFVIYDMQDGYKYNVNSIFTEKQEKWRSAFINTLSELAGMPRLCFEIEICFGEKINFRRRNRDYPMEFNIN